MEPAWSFRSIHEAPETPGSTNPWDAASGILLGRDSCNPALPDFAGISLDCGKREGREESDTHWRSPSENKAGMQSCGIPAVGLKQRKKRREVIMDTQNTGMSSQGKEARVGKNIWKNVFVPSNPTFPGNVVQVFPSSSPEFWD